MPFIGRSEFPSKVYEFLPQTKPVIVIRGLHVAADSENMAASSHGYYCICSMIEREAKKD
jgi:hypothetical protein